MKKYRIHLNTTGCGQEVVNEYIVPSDEDLETVVKGFAIKHCRKEGYSVNDIEDIGFDTDAFNPTYAVCIQSPEWRVLIWAGIEEPREVFLDSSIIELARSLPNDLYCENEKEVAEFISKINAIKEG